MRIFQATILHEGTKPGTLESETKVQTFTFVAENEASAMEAAKRHGDVLILQDLEEILMNIVVQTEMDILNANTTKYARSC